MWATLLPILLPILEHGVIALATFIVAWYQTHDSALAIGAAIAAAGLSAKPSSVLVKAVGVGTPTNPPAA